MGFFDSISTGWRFIKEAFGMAFDDRTLLKPSVYLVLTTIVYLTIWIAALIALDFDFEESTGASIAVGMSSTFGSFLIFYFFCGMTVNMVDAHLAGNRPSVGEAFRDARQNVLAICTLALVSTIVDLIVRAFRGDGDSLVGNIVASIIDSIWTVVTFLVLPAIIIEDVSMGTALKRVRELHKGNLLLISVGEVGVRAITGIIGFFVFILIGFVVYFSLATIGGTIGVVMAIGLGGTMLTLFAAFNVFVRMAYYTCLYLWACDVEKQGDTAPAPLPLARALRR